MGLRPKQHEALVAMRDRRAAGVLRQLIVAPTGFGKTVTFAHMPKPEYLNLQDRMLVFVHREELVEQNRDKIAKWNPDLRVEVEMADREASSNADVVVAGVQTAYAMNYRRLERLLDRGSYDIVVPDECHHYVTAETWKAVLTKTMERNPKALMAGFTATPNPTNGTAMGVLFDEIVFQYSLRQAVQDGWLVEPKGYRLKTKVDISGVKSQAGDFAVGQLERAVNVQERNELIVGQWLTLAPTRQTIAFCVDVQHAKDMADAFMRAGVPAQAIWAGDRDRAEKLAMHRKGALKVLTNCGILTEGYDDWQVSCVIMARPTKSQLLYTQCVGRGLRLPDGVENLVVSRQTGVPLEKQDCLLLDVCDVTEKMSLVTLPTLFGLPAKLDLNGASAVAALKKLEEEQEKNQNIDFSRLENLTTLSSYVEEAELWEVKFPDEVVEHSKLQWHRAYDNSYVLVIDRRGGESVRIKQNMLGKWDVVGRVKGFDVSEPGFPDLPAAFQYADQNVMLYGNKLLTLLRREGATWHQDTATVGQIRQLKRFRIPYKPGITKGEAAKLLTRKFAKGRW